jgi:uncharacterized protein YecE (DUF72 family)
MPPTVGSGDILVGCCGFPIGRDRYWREFPVAEVQLTFYQLPSPDRARRWREQAPEGRVLSMKAWQLITHPPSSPTYRRLRDPLAGPRDAYGFFRPTDQVLRAWDRTLEVARAMGAPVVVFQCPASFTPTDRHVEDLRGFFGRIDRHGLTLAWEPRGPWPQDTVAVLCRDLGLVHCVDPFVGPPATAGPVAYFRLHGVTGYRYRFTERDLQTLLDRCAEARAAGSRPVFALFNNLSMLEDARRFLALSAGV